MKKYKLKDLYNGDVIGYFNAKTELYKAQRNYDELVEGDWIPEIRIFNPETGKYRIAYDDEV